MKFYVLFSNPMVQVEPATAFFQLWLTGLFSLLHCLGLCWAPSTTAVCSIFKVFGMNRPGFKPRTSRLQSGLLWPLDHTVSQQCTRECGKKRSHFAEFHTMGPTVHMGPLKKTPRIYHKQITNRASTLLTLIERSGWYFAIFHKKNPWVHVVV